MFLNNKSILASMRNYMVSMTIVNPLGNLIDLGVPTKILISHQQLVLKHSTWYQINL